MIAGGAERDIAEPERQRRAEIGSHLIFPAIGQYRRKIAGRTAVQQQRQHQPQRRLQQHHKPDYQPRPGADQFDDKGGKPHETSEMPDRTYWPVLFDLERVIKRVSR